MKWTVIGADRNSGEDVKLTFEAASKGDAQRRANAGGVLVAHLLAEGEAVPATPKPIPAPAALSDVATRIELPATNVVKRILCPSCAESVLPSAYICPHCERTIIRDPRVIAFGLVAAAVTGLVVWFALGAMFDHAQNQAKQDADQIWTESQDRAKQLIKESRADAAKMMQDAQRDADAAMRKAAGQ